MIQIFARIKRPSLRWGLIFGIILGVVEVAYNFGASFVSDVNVQSILGYIMAFLFIITGFYAGLRAARETGRWTSGLAAGIWVAVFGTVIFFIIPIINTLINLQTIVASQQLYLKMHPVNGMKPSDYTASDVIVTQLVGMCLQMIFCALFTTVSGGLGGFVGRRRALLAAENGEEESIIAESAPPESEMETQETGPEELKDGATK